VAEILQTYEVGRVVRSLDPQALGRAISALLADPEALARMRLNAAAAAHSDLRWERESHRLFGLYHAVLGARVPEVLWADDRNDAAATRSSSQEVSASAAEEQDARATH
jgi:hypothetical protein